jgi:hypothetical protein
MDNEITASEGKSMPEKAKEKEKTSFGKKFWNFIMYGGFLVILVLAGVVFMVISKLTS